MALVMPPQPPFGPPGFRPPMQLLGSGQATPPMPPFGSRPPMQPFGSGMATPPMSGPMPGPMSGPMPPMSGPMPPMSGPPPMAPWQPLPSFPGPPPANFTIPGPPPPNFNIATPNSSPTLPTSFPGPPPSPSPWASAASMGPSGPLPPGGIFPTMPAFPPSGSFPTQPAFPPSMPSGSFPTQPAFPPSMPSGSFPTQLAFPPSGSFPTQAAFPASQLPPGGEPLPQQSSFQTQPPATMQSSLQGAYPIQQTTFQTQSPPGSMGPSFSGQSSLPPTAPQGGEPGPQTEALPKISTEAPKMLSPPAHKFDYYAAGSGSFDGVVRGGYADTTKEGEAAEKQDLQQQPLYEIEAPAPLDQPLHVGQYFAKYSSPFTPQYGVYDARQIEIAKQKLFASKITDYFSYGRAQLRNIVDVSNETFAERLVNAWQWCFIHADGWLINFWSCDQHGDHTPDFYAVKKGGAHHETQPVPVATIDMRQICAVHVLNDASSAEGKKCPWEVHFNFQRGYLPIRVQDEGTAKGWKGRIMKAIVENTKMAAVRDKMGDRSLVDAGLVDENDFGTSVRDLARMRRLKELWFQALDALNKRVQPPKSIYYDMYNLYDQAGGDSDKGNLSLVEIDSMAKELLDVKIEAVRRALLSAERTLHSPHRPVSSATHEEALRTCIETGRTLLATYMHMKDPQAFLDRVVSFHARTDISREGSVDVEEFMNAAPVFLLPTVQLRAEASFFAEIEWCQDAAANQGDDS